MTAYLVDVVVSLALSDPMHIHHEAVHHLFAGNVVICTKVQTLFARIYGRLREGVDAASGAATPRSRSRVSHP